MDKFILTVEELSYIYSTNRTKRQQEALTNYLSKIIKESEQDILILKSMLKLKR